MRTTVLGKTGLEVSPIALGCMSYGTPTQGDRAWTLPEEESRVHIRKALELGINFFDTANIYSLGSSEEIVGRALADFADRDSIVIATKIFGRMRSGPNGGNLSRKSIMQEVDHSLARLGTDYVDLLQIHRWDEVTPIEETLDALHDVVKAGKARYLGASSGAAWRFVQAVGLQRANHLSPFVSMQDHYNLINREVEREIQPFCVSSGIGMLAWSPLARGRLTRPWSDESARSRTDEYVAGLYGDTEGADRLVADVVGDLARERAVPRAQIALAWLVSRPGVTAPIVGATKPHHLDDAVAALELSLEVDEIARLEERYVPHAAAVY